MLPSTKKKNVPVDRSPFFAPSTPKVEVHTPGGTSVQVSGVKEDKATLVGTSANLVTAIIGAGIAGIPFAFKETGMITGVFLVILCAVLTLKSLRLLVETAKHTNVPSYETLAEACFGRAGFLFVSFNMFAMAYGAMVSYLMIVKDTLPALMGVSPDDMPMKRAVLFVISLTVMVPLSSQRDMADLAKTSRISVFFDTLMVLVVVYVSPWQETDIVATLQTSIFRPDTVFVGLGVLSFAFVCQVRIVLSVFRHRSPYYIHCLTDIRLLALGIYHCGLS
jgi:sodium-coupled neutral amino acid transporter 11